MEKRYLLCHISAAVYSAFAVFFLVHLGRLGLVSFKVVVKW